jgi:hypothetical protein
MSMPNELARSLGQTGEMVERSSQNYVAKRLSVSKGACWSICAKFMTGTYNSEIPTSEDYLETGALRAARGRACFPPGAGGAERAAGGRLHLRSGRAYQLGFSTPA